MLVQTTLDAGITGTEMSGSFRGHAITTVTLSAGTTYTIAGYGAGRDLIHEIGSTTGFEINGITMGSGIYDYAWPTMPASLWSFLIGPNLGYTVSGGNAYTIWSNGTFANGATLTDKDPASDPDGDSQTNQQEFAFGLDPTTGASANPISHPLDKATGIFKYTRNKESGLTYIYESSTTLSNPWDVFTSVSTTSNNLSPVEEVTVTVPPSLLSDPKRFLRVKAE